MIHFEYYPSIEYSNNLAKNIMVRGKIRDAVLKNNVLYYKYTVEDHMKPEIISNKYYGSPNYVWVIFYTNNIFDPVQDWVRASREFDLYIEQKYGSVRSATSISHSDGTFNWDAIKHCVEYDPDSKLTYVIDRPTFEKKFSQGDKNVKPVSLYEYENELNEKKRDIIVLDKKFLPGILDEMRNLFSDT